jgi:hypothetical protein
MKIIQSFTTGLALLTAILLFADQARAELIFDNSLNYQTNYTFSTNSSTLEFGDELHLAGTARTITNFQFEYFGDFLRSGDETARIRFYKNDGPGRYPSPNTLLYDSGLFPIFPGLNTVPLTGISVLVPDVFTWTVQFGGLTGRPGDEAGLIFYNPPTTGATLPGGVIGSFDDYWQKPATGWNLYRFNGNPVANFGARVFAFPDPPILITSSNRLADGTYELQLTGPIGQAIIIEGSTNQVDWTPLATNTFTSGVMTFVDTQGGSFTERSYRAIAKPDSLNLQSVKLLAGGAFQFEIAGSPGRKFVVEASSDFAVWTPIATNTISFLGSPVTFVDSQAAIFNNRFYRAQAAP